jgi:isopenicillin-N epimerase
VDRITHARRHLAAFLGADPDGTAMIGNATAGVAIVLQSLGLQTGDEIVFTDHGYGSVSLAVERECRRTGAVARTLPVPLRATGEEIVEIVRAGLRPGRTRLLIVDQITSSTARVFPVAAIVAAARASGIPVLVDAAHAPGMLADPVDSLGADFWVGNLHKWAYAPRGSAVLVVADRWRERIEPLAVSWEQESGFPRRVEHQATLDYSPWLAAPVGVFTLRTLGLDRVRAHNAALAAYGQRVVGEALGLGPSELPEPGGPGIAMRILPLPAGLATTFPDATALRLHIADKLATEVAVNAWGGRGWLRLCGQVYNHAGEYDQLARRLPALLNGRG